jgi:hypothetical protein
VALGLLADAERISFNLFDTERMRNVHESINEVHFSIFVISLQCACLLMAGSIPIASPSAAHSRAAMHVAPPSNSESPTPSNFFIVLLGRVVICHSQVATIHVKPDALCEQRRYDFRVLDQVSYAQ